MASSGSWRSVVAGSPSSDLIEEFVEGAIEAGYDIEVGPGEGRYLNIRRDGIRARIACVLPGSGRVYFETPNSFDRLPDTGGWGCSGEKGRKAARYLNLRNDVAACLAMLDREAAYKRSGG